MLPRTRVRLPGFTTREAELANEIEEMHAIVQNGDWFLEDCIAKKAQQLKKMYTERVSEQHERYVLYKRSLR